MNELLARSWWMLAVLGVIAMLFAVLALVWPGLTLLSLVALFAAYALSGGIMWIIGANALITGVLEIVAAIRLRREIQGEWLMILTGVISIAFGVFVFLFPGAGALALVWLISLYAAFTGALLLALAFRARVWGMTGQPETPSVGAS